MRLDRVLLAMYHDDALRVIEALRAQVEAKAGKIFAALRVNEIDDVDEERAVVTHDPDHLCVVAWVDSPEPW
jgi:hypothetical protein